MKRNIKLIMNDKNQIINDFHEITSKSNSKIKEIQKINRNFKTATTFMVEGINLVKEAYKHNNLIAIYTTDRSYLSLFKNVKIYVVRDYIMPKISSLKTPLKIIAEVKKNKQNLDYQQPTLILENIQDPGNLGTLIRTAYALGVKNIICSPNSVNFYNSKVIQASQGYLFNVNLITSQLQPILNKLKEKKYQIIGTHLHMHNTVSLYDLDSNINLYALVLGNEGNGISEYIMNYFDKNVNIRIYNNVNSLNIAIAGAIIMNHLSALWYKNRKWGK